ncbi:MAG: glycosyltransferase [Rhodothermia bacterium]|nr:glycosyltransferase [Rhodothermia bacterium]
MEREVTDPPRSSKRIALVGPSFPHRGGIAHFVDRLTAEMAAAGHEPVVVSFRRLYPDLLFPGKSQFEETSERSVPGQAPPTPGLPILDSLNPFTWRRAALEIIDRQCEIVVLNHWLPFFAPALGAIARRVRKKGLRTVLVVHNALPHERRPGDIWLTRFVLNAGDKLISLSEEVRRQLSSVFKRDSVVVPHPVYDHFGEVVEPSRARDELGLPPDAKAILFFGFVRRYKGLDILLEAMPEIVRQLPDALLLVAGEFYKDAAPYHELVDRLGVSQNVRFEDRYIATEQVPFYFSAADVVVQPYRSATQSGVAQIALHYACPVITTDVGGLSEIVHDGETGIVVPAPDSKLIGEAVVRFFKDGLGDRMSSSIATFRQGRSWESLVAEIETA